MSSYLLYSNIRQVYKEAALQRLQLCVGENTIEKLRTSEWNNLSNEPTFTLYILTADAYIHLIREGYSDWRLNSITQDKTIKIQ